MSFSSTDEEPDDDEIDTSPLRISYLDPYQDLHDPNPANPSRWVGISSLPGIRFKQYTRSLTVDLKYLSGEENQEPGEHGHNRQPQWASSSSFSHSSGGWHRITDVFCLCTVGELIRYRVPGLLEGYRAHGIRVHHFPHEDGTAQTPEETDTLLTDLLQSLNALPGEEGAQQHQEEEEGVRGDIAPDGRETNSSGPRAVLVHCMGGLGRSGAVVACLLLRVSVQHHVEAVRRAGDNGNSSQATNDSSSAPPIMKPEEAVARVRAVRSITAVQTMKQLKCVDDYYYYCLDKYASGYVVEED
eukprot:Nk52_evm13s153 gene=Nk52_evmTU13s153